MCWVPYCRLTLADSNIQNKIYSTIVPSVQYKSVVIRGQQLQYHDNSYHGISITTVICKNNRGSHYQLPW